MENQEVVLPQASIDQLELAAMTRLESVKANQERRTAIGRELRLDVGEPNEARVLVEGKVPVPVRDALGMFLDPSFYAKKSCNSCYGRGVISYLTAEDRKGNLIRLKDDERDLRKCGCVEPRYVKAYTAFGDRLVKEGLADKNQIQSRYELK